MPRSEEQAPSGRYFVSLSQLFEMTIKSGKPLDQSSFFLGSSPFSGLGRLAVRVSLILQAPGAAQVTPRSIAFLTLSFGLFQSRTSGGTPGRTPSKILKPAVRAKDQISGE